VDWQVVGILGTAFFGALGAVITGIYTGRNGRKKDEAEAENRREEAKQAREVAEETASRARVEAIAADAISARQRLREAEEEYDRKVRELRRDRDKGWALASYYFGLLGTLAHLLNQIFQLNSPDVPVERLQAYTKTAQMRMRDIRIPTTMDDPVPSEGK
jgi:hypothetical protein